MNKSLLLPLLFTTVVTSTAQARSFDIELLFFKRNSENAQTVERWPEHVSTPDFLSSKELLLAADECAKPTVDCSQQLPVQPVVPQAISASINGRAMLSPGQLRLSYIRKKLDRHSEYTPLLHLGWREYVKSPSTADFAHLFGGKNFSYQYDQDGNPVLSQPIATTSDKKITITADTTEINTPAQTTATHPPLWELDGLVKISLNHYLYVEFDMLLRGEDKRPVLLTAGAPTAELQNIAAESSEPSIVIGDTSISSTTAFGDNETLETYLHSYSFKQKRRVKSEEIHYFDHPKIGLIVQIRKLKAKTSSVDQ